MKPRILVLDGGLHHGRAFAWLHQAALVPVSRVQNESLTYYDVIVVPFHTDQVALSALRSGLESFLANGGVVVVLGATEEAARNWIPFTNWTGPFTTDVDKVDVMSADGQAIFGGLQCPGDLKYHGIYYAHGSLLHQYGRRLAETADGRTVMLVRREGIRGTLLCTTLDPDFHSVSSVPGPNLEETSQTHEKAGRLLRNMIEWSIGEFMRKPLWLRGLRRLLGTGGRYLNRLSYWVLLGLPAGVLLYMQLITSDAGDRSPVRILMIALSSIGLVGSLMAVWQRWHWWRSGRK